jgi:hypothetical protein
MLSHFATAGAAQPSASAAAGAVPGPPPPLLPPRPLPPRLLACTHFHELARPDVLPPHPQIAFFEMAVLTDAPAGGGAGGTSGGASAATAGPTAADEEVVFLYRLAPGHSAPSFGLHCARLCGLPPALLARAAAVIEARRGGGGDATSGGGGGGGGGAVARLELPPLQARDARYRALARRLAAADLGAPDQAAALLAAAAGAC